MHLDSSLRSLPALSRVCQKQRRFHFLVSGRRMVLGCFVAHSPEVVERA